MKKAYIYSRISSKRQTTGNGLDRQADIALTYCYRNKLEVQEQVFDVASGYHGKQMEGALGIFLDAVKAKVVPVGSVLVIESLDRLGREHTMDALPRFIEIVNAGIEIREISTDTRYTREETHKLHLAIAIMERAHNESLMKSRRALAAREALIKRASEGQDVVLNKYTPAWIDIIDGKLTLNEHAVTVKRIFDLYLAGNGCNTISKMFRQEDVPFIEPKRNNRMKRLQGWTPARVVNVLNSPSCYGTYHAFRGKTKAEIENYFPSCINQATYQKAQLIKQAKDKAKNKAENIRSVLSGSLRCSCCHGTYECITSKWKTTEGISERVRIRCASAARGQPCKSRTIPVDELEAAVLSMLPDVDINQLNRGKHGTLEVMKSKSADMEVQLDNLLDLVAAGSAKAKEKFVALEAKKAQLDQDLIEAESRIVKSFDSTYVVSEVVDINNTELRKKVQTALVIAGVEVWVKSLLPSTADISVFLKDDCIGTKTIKWKRKKFLN